MLVNSNYEIASNDLNNQVVEIDKIIKKELEEGSLDIKDLKLCIAHFVKCVWDSDRY